MNQFNRGSMVQWYFPLLYSLTGALVHGTLTERGRLGTVNLLVLTSLDQLFLIWRHNLLFFTKTRYPNEEIKCTEPSSSVTVPWFVPSIPLQPSLAFSTKVQCFWVGPARPSSKIYEQVAKVIKPFIAVIIYVLNKLQCLLHCKPFRPSLKCASNDGG